jgi:hypothetical protein
MKRIGYFRDLGLGVRTASKLTSEKGHGWKCFCADSSGRSYGNWLEFTLGSPDSLPGL